MWLILSLLRVSIMATVAWKITLSFFKVGKNPAFKLGDVTWVAQKFEREGTRLPIAVVKLLPKFNYEFGFCTNDISKRPLPYNIFVNLLKLIFYSR